MLIRELGLGVAAGNFRMSVPVQIAKQQSRARTWTLGDDFSCSPRPRKRGTLHAGAPLADELLHSELLEVLELLNSSALSSAPCQGLR